MTPPKAKKAIGHGSLIWARIQSDAEGKSRPCVVLSATPHMCEVAWGRGEQRGAHSVLVRERSATGKALGLTKDTYFCAVENIFKASIDRDDLDGECDPLTLLDLDQLAENVR